MSVHYFDETDTHNLDEPHKKVRAAIRKAKKKN